MLKIRRPLGRLIFNMGIAIPGKTVFLIETAPRFSLYSLIKRRPMGSNMNKATLHPMAHMMFMKYAVLYTLNISNTKQDLTWRWSNLLAQWLRSFLLKAVLVFPMYERDVSEQAWKRIPKRNTSHVTFSWDSFTSNIYVAFQHVLLYINTESVFVLYVLQVFLFHCYLLAYHIKPFVIFLAFIERYACLILK